MCNPFGKSGVAIVLQFVVSLVHILTDCGNLTFLISMKLSLCLTFPLKGSFIALDFSILVYSTLLKPDEAEHYATLAWSR